MESFNLFSQAQSRIGAPALRAAPAAVRCIIGSAAGLTGIEVQLYAMEANLHAAVSPLATRAVTSSLMPNSAWADLMVSANTL